jgi:hypothetical protein
MADRIAQISSDTSFADAYREIELENACSRAMTEWFTPMKKERNMTFGEAADLFVEDKNARESWAAWGVLTFADKFTTEIRLKVIKKIKDPSRAYHVWSRLTNMTSDEESYLKSVFEHMNKSRKGTEK